VSRPEPDPTSEAAADPAVVVERPPVERPPVESPSAESPSAESPSAERPPALPPSGVAPDPLKGFRGPVSAALVLEVIVLLLTLLVVGKFGGQNGGAFGVAVVLGLAAVMVVLVRFAGRSWVPAVAAGLQLVMIACGVLVFALAVLGVVFGLVWLALLLMRRDLAQKLARGELPSQRG
jgi:hypothetical protein